MKESIFTFRKKEGQVSVWRKKEMQDLVKSLEDGDYEWVLRKKKKKRSNEQNRYYWGIVIESVLSGLIDAGYERRELNPQVVHEFLTKTFLTKNIANESGEFINVIKHTSELSTVEMLEYIADIQQWSAETLNVIILDPNEQSHLDL